MSTHKVEVAKIDRVETHPNADRLDIAYIKGWQSIVPRGAYKAGDLCVYIPIDSVLPPKVEVIVCGPESYLTKGRVRSIKLRGALSQGIIADLSSLRSLLPMPESRLREGLDVTRHLGITKYEPSVKMGGPQKGCKQVSYKQSNPHFKKYTGIENFKNHPDLFTSEDVVVVTEKIHGTNFRCGWVPKHRISWWDRVLKVFGLYDPYEFVYGSHNVQLQDKKYNGYYDGEAGNVYLQAVDLYRLRECIPKGYIYFGEIFGDKIQKNYTYNCGPGARRVLTFDVYCTHTNRWLDSIELKHFIKQYELPDSVPVLYTGFFNRDAILEVMQGPSKVAISQKIKEGVVIKPLKESTCYIGRKMLKYINDEYLLDIVNTDYH